MICRRIAGFPSALALALAVVFTASVASAVEKVNVPAAETAELTVYQNGLGLVVEKRTASIGATGPFGVSLTGIPATAVQGSARFTGDRLDPRRMHYRLRPLDRQLLLESKIGEIVTLIRSNPQTGEEKDVTARLVALEGQWPLLEIDGRIEINPPGRLVFDNRDADLAQRPAIDVFGHALAPGERPVEVRFLTSGIGWHASYDMTLGGTEAEPRLDVLGWAMIRNDLGRDYVAEPLRLVAGQINRISRGGGAAQPQAERMMMAMADVATPTPVREAASDAHIYTVGGGVQVPAGETQLRLLARSEVEVERRYVFDGNQQVFWGPVQNLQPFQNPAIEISFRNSGAEPLPAGDVRLYDAADNGGRLIGETQLPGIPANARATFRTGRAFDIRIGRLQTAFRRLSAPENGYESTHKLTVSNAKEIAVTVAVREPVGSDWEMIDESHPHTRKGLTPVWLIDVPAAGSATLTYTVKVRR